MSTQGNPESSPNTRLLEMIQCTNVHQAIYVAAKLGIADLLADGVKSPDGLANATGTHSRSLFRVLRALASVGIFAENEDSGMNSRRWRRLFRPMFPARYATPPS